MTTPTSYITITNDTTPAHALKLGVKHGTWNLSTPDSAFTRDLAGLGTLSLSASAGKATITFTAQVKATPGTGEVALGVQGVYTTQTVYVWAVPDTAAHAILSITDVDGVTRNMAWTSGWKRPPGLTSDAAGSQEVYEFPVKLEEY